MIRELDECIQGNKSGPIVLRPGDRLIPPVEKINLLLQQPDESKERKSGSRRLFPDGPMEAVLESWSMKLLRAVQRRSVSSSVVRNKVPEPVGLQAKPEPFKCVEVLPRVPPRQGVTTVRFPMTFRAFGPLPSLTTPRPLSIETGAPETRPAVRSIRTVILYSPGAMSLARVKS